MVQVGRNLCVFFKAVQQFPSASTGSCSSAIEKALFLPNTNQQSTKKPTQSYVYYEHPFLSGSWSAVVFWQSNMYQYRSL